VEISPQKDKMAIAGSAEKVNADLKWRGKRHLKQDYAL